MKKIVFLLYLFIICSALPIQSREYKVKDIPMVHLQDKRRYVSNPDNILSEEAVMAMDTALYSLEQKTGIQTLVVVVSGIEGGDCFDFAHRLGEENGVGEKNRDNGLVILLSTDERCVQFATGYGIEGDLPDAICKRIQSRYMLPYFKKGDWNSGMVAGVNAVKGYLDGSMERINNDEEDLSPGVILVFVGIFLSIILLGIFLAWWKKRCPVCHKHTIQRINSKVISRINGIKREAVTYKCMNCGHTYVKYEDSDDENYHRPGGGGPIIGGFGGFGSGRGGGGFSGGSFGGGSFGGGGSGSRF